MATGTTLDRAQAVASTGTALAVEARADGPTILCDQPELREVLLQLWLLLREANEEDGIS